MIVSFDDLAKDVLEFPFRELKKAWEILFRERKSTDSSVTIINSASKNLLAAIMGTC
jgi:hypothetical protein